MTYGNRRRYLAEQEAFMAEKLDYTISKAEPLKTHMKERDAKRVVGRVGLAGPLPKEYTREQKMGAYEARYISAGGRKGEKWQRRAERSDKVKTAGLGVATAGGAAWLAGRTKLGSKVKVTPKRREVADNIAVGGATVGGAGELYGMRARRKRASYSSAPGGAAASALRRMRAMDAARSQR